MMNRLFCHFCRRPAWVILGLAGLAGGLRVQANPTGGVVAQGAASFSSSGSQFTINQTSPTAFINWQTFNIGAGETTTFHQPSSASVTWNYINDPNASSINGNLNANGYVVLQNPNGFMVGGAAAITAHGLVMTTASTPNLNLGGSGAWTFDAPPPTAKIVNYGKINVTGGGSAYLIANNIENNGAISAPGGKIGLYAGKQVLVSMSPDGRGLSVQVTLPQGSVDNNGNLTADAGSIVAQAQTVNQNGLVQANSVQDVHGTIELVASSAVNLGASSVISAHGDVQGASAGGSVTIESDNSFSDQAGSTINIAGGAQGGNGGQAEISAPEMGDINTSVNGQAAAGFDGGIFTLDPANLWLASASTDPSAPSGYSVVNVNSFNGLSQINLQADNNIALNTAWTLANQTAASALTLSAGNSITLNSGADISAGENWSVNMTAGATLPSGTVPTAGNDGIYLNEGTTTYLQTQNGDINLWAANEVIVGSGAIRTVGGGNIAVTTQYGNVNSGTGANGFDYLVSAPYYTPDPSLSGISTAAGGNVNITALRGDVICFPTTTVAAGDPGTGAFGPEPGNVTINAGGSVYGHFVEANGAGAINAGQNIGTASKNVALSLVKGSWNLNAGWNPTAQSVQTGTGNIYLQEVRNPNGVFDNLTAVPPGGRRSAPTAGNHLFDYDPAASVTLTAGNGIYLTGANLPRPNDAVPMLLPPTLIINAGPGGVTLQTPTAYDGSGNPLTLLNDDIILFPSPDANLQITTTDGGGLSSGNANDTAAYLLMSDSGLTQWYNANSGSAGIVPFGPLDHASVPVELNNNQPVTINLTGSKMVNGVLVPASMENVTLQTDKATDINVAGDMTGCSFFGENLHANDVTSITVGGQIYYASSFTSVTLDQAFPDLLQTSQSLPAGETYLPPGADLWYAVLQYAVNPALLNNQSYSSLSPQALTSILSTTYVFGNFNGANLDYNAGTKTLTAAGPLSSDVLNALTSPYVYLVRYGTDGNPLLDANGHFIIDKVSWAPSDGANLNSLFANSQGKPPLVASGAFIVGGTGEFDVTADSINLGNSDGILSVGVGGNPTSRFLGRVIYSYLAPYITSGATINVVANYLEMPSSTIAALGGGDVNVVCNGEIPGSPVNASGVGVSMDLGSPDLADFEEEIMNGSNLGLGIYTTGGGAVNVTALGTINVDTSRIGAFNGGNIAVASLTGDVNAGSGGAIAIPINTFPVNAIVNPPYEYVYANGIAAETLAPEPNGSLVPGAAAVPGDITVSTPQGSIYASLGGILQESLSGTLPNGPTVNLTAGTPAGGDWNSTATPEYVGNIDMGQSGVIGGTVNVKATGKVSGVLISQQNANVTGQTVGNLTVLAAGTANVSAQSGGSSITIIGGQGVNASGLGSSATLLGQNVSVNGGSAQSTLGSSATASASSQSAAGQASTEAQQQVAANGGSGDDEKKKKKKAEIRRVGRVTVILSAAVPAQ
jgi:filamentous hemagglutinin family protein